MTVADRVMEVVWAVVFYALLGMVLRLAGTFAGWP